MSNETEKPDGSETESKDTGKGEGTKDLNTLLAEWEGEGSKTKDKPKSDDAVLQHLADLSYKVDIPKVIGLVKGDLDISDRAVENYINGRAGRDEKLLKLWNDRDSNREAFEEAMLKLHDELKEDFKLESKKESPKADKDDDKLSAAVRGARSVQSTGTDLDNVDFGSLSDHDFALKKQEVFRLAGAGKLSTG